MLDEDAVAALEVYAFPGNACELENILERAITLSTGGEVSASDIQLRPTHGDVPATNTQSGGDWGIISKISSATPFGERWNKLDIIKTAAAEVLGMSFRALRYRIKKLGIE